MTLDKRPIFTVGMVWTDFVKRLPRTAPRYRRELGANPLGAWAGLGMAGMTPEQINAVCAQQQAMFGPLRSNPSQYGPLLGNWPW